MSAVELLQPVLEGGLQRNNFFNGRLLSAEDLRAEQDANRTREGQLARAAGDGVAWGMNVTLGSVGSARPTVMVSGGLALNRRGDLLRLGEDTEVALVPETRAAEVAAGIFAECEPPRPTPDLSGEGVYVLVVSPASGYSGRALVSDPNTTAAGRGACGARFAVEYVQFRLVPMAIMALDGIAPLLKSRVAALIPPAGSPARERLRNLLAHLCFGTQALGDYFADPLKMLSGRPAWGGWGALDAMRDIGDLTDCDVPIALVVLTEAGVSLVDAWSVRRRLLDAAAIDAWRGVADRGASPKPRPRSCNSSRSSRSSRASRRPRRSRRAATSMCFPQAAGCRPVPAGFNWATFLGPHAPPDVTAVDSALLRGILERSWFDEPFALATTPPVPVRVYQVPGASFVVFARAATGNLRVIFSPAPAASQDRQCNRHRGDRPGDQGNDACRRHRADSRIFRLATTRSRSPHPTTRPSRRSTRTSRRPHQRPEHRARALAERDDPGRPRSTRQAGRASPARCRASPRPAGTAPGRFGSHRQVADLRLAGGDLHAHRPCEWLQDGHAAVGARWRAQ